MGVQTIAKILDGFRYEMRADRLMRRALNSNAGGAVKSGKFADASERLAMKRENSSRAPAKVFSLRQRVLNDPQAKIELQ